MLAQDYNLCAAMQQQTGQPDCRSGLFSQYTPSGIEISMSAIT